jgi:hypothetical protein
MYDILVGLGAIAMTVALAVLAVRHLVRANDLVGRGRRGEMLDAFNITGVAIAILAVGTYISPEILMPFDFALVVAAVIIGWLVREAELQSSLLDIVDRLDKGESPETVFGSLFGRWLS